jgi:ubiquinone/menaquinone biosynthesis C-methylase UbiE
MSFVLHEVENKQQMLCNIYNVFRSDGKIVILEFSKKALFGLPKHERISENEINKLLENEGFTDISFEKYNFFAYLAKARKL